MSDPSTSAVKTLFAHSRNLCFFERCEEKLTDPGWKQVAGEVAHIKGERPGSARFDPFQAEVERQSITNLMILCPKHHKLIDRLESDKYPVERLAEMREKHLGHSALDDWCTPEQALGFAQLAIDFWRQQPSTGLRIISARYGADETFVDVTDIVARKVAGDKLTMEVTNETMAGDPVPNVIKELRVQYQYNGVSNSSETTEGETVMLP